MASTTLTEPFLLSSQIATLDHVSHGRAGWQLQVSTLPEDAAYVGPRAVPEPAERYAEALEHAEVVRRLWDSWDDDAEIRDADSHRFIDRDRIHHIDFAGDHLQVLGPSITPRPPQGQPIVVAQVREAPSQAVAAAVADIAILAADDSDQLATQVAQVRHAAAENAGRRGRLVVLADVDVALGPAVSGASGFSPIRTVTGSAAEAAERLHDWARLGVDGFRLRPARLPHDLDAIAGPLRSELRERGLLSAGDAPATLRERLGLPRPVSVYAAV